MTTVQAQPAEAWAALEQALHQRQAVHVSYHGRQRLVCPHALGWKNHRPMLLGYQIGGQTSSGPLDPDPRKRWRNMFIDEIAHVDLADRTTPWATADNYDPSRPFNSIDEVAVAISPGDPPHGG